MADPNPESWFQRAQAVWTDPRSASFAVCAVILGTYWILSSVTLVVDMTRRCRANKFQPEKWPDFAMLTDVIGHVLLQQVLLIVPTFYFLGPTIMSTFFSLTPELPSFQRVIFDIVSFIIGAEVWFYYTHRLFHHPALYGPIHKWCVGGGCPGRGSSSRAFLFVCLSALGHSCGTCSPYKEMEASIGVNVVCPFGLTQAPQVQGAFRLLRVVLPSLGNARSRWHPVFWPNDCWHSHHHSTRYCVFGHDGNCNSSRRIRRSWRQSASP